MLENLDINIFLELLSQIKETIPPEYERLLGEYITKNSELFSSYKKINSLVDPLLNKPIVLKTLFKIISHDLKPDEKLEILNKVANTHTLDLSLIIAIMETNDIMPNNTTFTNLLSKTYFRTVGAPNAKLIADIIDIFVMYGFKITKDIVLTMLRKGCYVNSIEKFPVPIDESILEVCAELGYYPYDFSCIPPHKVMLKECSKDNNLEQIKKLKEKGGIINVECLEKACFVRKNGRTIKYIITDCKVKPNDTCLDRFQQTYGVEALDLMMQNYSNKKEEIKNSNKIDLDDDSTMSIERKKIEINNETEFILKNKIKKLLSYNKETIKYSELYELMLNYLIKHKLIIGNYFVINGELCNLIKISQCTLINIDQLDNMLTYFINVK